MPAPTNLRAWHGDPALKARTLATARAHIDADLLAHGEIGRVEFGERGCSVACTVGTYDHSLYPERLGIPEWLARLQDSIYEGLPRDEHGLDVRWTEDLLGAIPVGARVDDALTPILCRILEDVALPAVTIDNWGVRDAIRDVIGALRYSGPDRDERLRAAAEAAGAAAWDAAWDAAWEPIRAIVLEELTALGEES